MEGKSTFRIANTVWVVAPVAVWFTVDVSWAISADLAKRCNAYAYEEGRLV